MIQVNQVTINLQQVIHLAQPMETNLFCGFSKWCKILLIKNMAVSSATALRCINLWPQQNGDAISL